MLPLTIYADVRAALPYDIGRVWRSIAAFGALEQWACGISSCSLAEEAQGMVRTVTLGGRSVRERLEHVDEAEHRLRYQILSPHGLPVRDVFGEIHLDPRGAAKTGIRWYSEANDFTVPPAQLGARIENFYRRSIEGLGNLLARA